MDEKLPLLGGEHEIRTQVRHDGADPRRRRGSPLALTLAFTIAFFFLASVFFLDDSEWDEDDSTDPGLQDAKEFDWSKVKPSSDLKYVPCYKNQQCARLEVPLDWNSTDPHSTRAVLAIVKRPAQVDVTDASYGGAILFNPGGPGGSGVQLMQLYGEAFVGILNVDLTTTGEEAYANQSRYYDLISWDPRGVGATRPLVEGFTDPLISQAFEQRFSDLSGSLLHRQIFNRVFEIKGIWGKLLSLPQKGFSDEEHPARFVGTTSVIRDMVEIIEKHGQWREKTAEAILKSRRNRGEILTTAERSAIKDRTAYVKHQEKLQFWGFSYGTVIGQTFASMYPDRVGRLAIDGVVNATDYYAGDWKTELIDSEKITKNFTLECEAAGPESCAFAKLIQDSNETLMDAFERTLVEIQEIPLSGLVDRRPIYITDYVVRALLYNGFYSGLFGYQNGADLLANAASRNLSFFDVQELNPVCDDTPAPFHDPTIGQTIILCADGESKLNQTQDDYWEYVQFLQKQSKNYGDFLTRITLPCHAFSIRPKWRFAGPFGAKTANPMLILSQTLDPITPLASAQGAHKLFPGSQIVEAQGMGHCTLGYPSLCAMKEVKKYFYTGQVPKEYTYCAASLRPFRSAQDVMSVTNELPEGDRRLLTHALNIAKNFPPGNEALRYGKREQRSQGYTGTWQTMTQQVWL